MVLNSANKKVKTQLSFKMFCHKTTGGNGGKRGGSIYMKKDPTERERVNEWTGMLSLAHLFNNVHSVSKCSVCTVGVCIRGKLNTGNMREY